MTAPHTLPDQVGDEDLLNGIDFGDTNPVADPEEPAGTGPAARGVTSARASRPPAAGKNRGAVDRLLVKRTASKTVEVGQAPAAQRRMLAGLLGCPDDVAVMATEVMCAPRGALAAIADLDEVSSADPMEAGVIVASWERPRSNALWSLLVDLGAVKGTRPQSDAKAAIAIARAALGLSDDDKALLTGVAALARKS